MSNYGSDSGGTSPGDMPIGEQPNVSPGGYTPAPGQPPPTQYGPPPTYVPPSGYAPPPGGPQMGMTGMAPPPRRRSPLLIIGIIVVAFLLLCGVGVALLIGGVFAATQPVVNAGDAYMSALRDGDYNKAFDLSTPALQQEVGSADNLKAAVGSKQPTSWSFTSRSINNGQGSLSGTTTFTDGTNGTVDMGLSQVGNDWKVSGIRLK
jgi:hypothetical protein